MLSVVKILTTEFAEIFYPIKCLVNYIFLHFAIAYKRTTMIIIFLDIDGVLFYNPMDGRVHKRAAERLQGKNVPKPYPAIEFDRAAVDLFDEASLHYLDKLIADIIQQTQQEVGIVLSSSWRIGYSLEELQDLFKQHAFSKYLIDKTPEFFGKSRGDEIAQWLKENKEQHNVVGFVILDDDDSGLSKNFPEAFVKFDYRRLFKAEEHQQALDVVLKCHTTQE